MSAADVARWHVPPARQGQTVEIAYGTDDSGRGYRRRTDRSDGSVSYAWCDLSDCGCESECDHWDPANTVPSAYQWSEIRAT